MFMNGIDRWFGDQDGSRRYLRSCKQTGDAHDKNKSKDSMRYDGSINGGSKLVETLSK